MRFADKVVWSEGMFLNPHHFQQQDRYFEGLLQQYASMAAPYRWGVNELQIDEQLLLLGKFSIQVCSGIFPDGTSFSIPARDNAPLPLDIPPNTANKVIYLALPSKRSGVPEVSFMPHERTPYHRYQVETLEMSDNNSSSERMAPVQVARLSLSLLLLDKDKQGFSCIGLVCVAEIHADHKVWLDKHYLPPCLNVHVLPNFSSLIKEVQGLLHYRGTMLMQRLTDSGTGGVAEIADFMLLQIMNRYEPLLGHFSKLSSLHPEQLYCVLVQLVGEMATFTGWQKRPISLPDYVHDELASVFAPVMTELRRALSMVLEESVVALKVEEREQPNWVAILADKSLLEKAQFVLGVYASMPQENLRAQFPAQVKVAPVEEIRNLVNKALPGIVLTPLAVAPRQIPYHSNCAYFALDGHHNLWQKLKHSAGIAFHVGGDFPRLRMELWAIKGKHYE